NLHAVKAADNCELRSVGHDCAVTQKCDALLRMFEEGSREREANSFKFLKYTNVGFVALVGNKAKLSREGAQRAYRDYTCDRVASLLDQANPVSNVQMLLGKKSLLVFQKRRAFGSTDDQRIKRIALTKEEKHEENCNKSRLFD
ncbi:hypothetical protein K0M31_003975, partial [Melipona bicolor]